MKFDVMLTGVGGEGVLTAGVVIARAANLDGHFVRGVQLHGLAQRGGTIPTFVRFGSRTEIFSPKAAQADADLVLSFEPLETVRATYYARADKTAFVINDWPHMPIYANLLNLPYPSMAEIIKRIKPFAKSIHIFKAHHLAKKRFRKPVLGNTILISAAVGAGLLPLSERSLRAAVKITAPRNLEQNLQALQLGLELGKRALEEHV